MGKRYKLIKDLPHVKAGERCHISLTDNLVTDDGVLIYHKNQLKNFPNILRDWFEEIPEKPKTVDDLKNGDPCYIIVCSLVDREGPRAQRVFYDPGLKPWLEMGELYPSLEECNKAITKQKAETILRRDTKEFKAKIGSGYYQVCYDPEADRFYHVRRDGTVWHEGLKFAIKGDAEDSIRKHEKEWKTYLGVEE